LKGKAPRVIRYAVIVAIAYSSLQVVLTAMGLAVGVAAPFVLVGEIAISLVVLASLWMLGGREYLVAVSLLAVHICLGVAFTQWQSPLLWVAMAVMVYLLWPPRLKWCGWMGVEEIRWDIARYGRNHPRRCAHSSFKRPSRRDLSEWRVRW
jgi:hypothetical protein